MGDDDTVRRLSAVICNNCAQRAPITGHPVGASYDLTAIIEAVTAACPYQPYGPHWPRIGAKKRSYQHTPLELSDTTTDSNASTTTDAWDVFRAGPRA